MIILLMILSAITYSIYAYLPFLSLSPKLHYIAGALLAMAGSLVWVTVSRSVDKGALIGYGLIFDAIITAAFAIVPALVYTVSMSYQQYVACVLLLSSIILFKLG